jgi:hypothetical protein
MYTSENLPMRERESQNNNYDAAFRIIFRICKCFHRGKQKLCKLNFSPSQSSIKISKPFSHVHKVLIENNRPAKKYFPHDPSL